MAADVSLLRLPIGAAMDWVVMLVEGALRGAGVVLAAADGLLRRGVMTVKRGRESLRLTSGDELLEAGGVITLVLELEVIEVLERDVIEVLERGVITVLDLGVLVLEVLDRVAISTERLTGGVTLRVDVAGRVTDGADRVGVLRVTEGALVMRGEEYGRLDEDEGELEVRGATDRDGVEDLLAAGRDDTLGADAERVGAGVLVACGLGVGADLEGALRVAPAGALDRSVLPSVYVQTRTTHSEAISHL
ncbi:MAG TPA: hypothetical protein P5279_14240 [Anaerohalosphaeraceae bacterium]|nr:hypothetical protein [Anaerohalosphaeraceae bacterium]HRT51647.1 hypothetical protein [Anaerohalosphaeraceae bacterium]HRT87688.1 hypothetical protein [Anaerohalosphaeraceae bacterium]